MNLNIYCTSWTYSILLANATAQNDFFRTTYILSYTLECSLHNSTKSMLYMACFGAVTICSVNTLWINRAPLHYNTLVTHSSIEDYSIHHNN